MCSVPINSSIVTEVSEFIPSLLNTVYGSGIVPFIGGVFDKIKVIMSYKAQPQTGVDLILPSNCHLWFLPAMFTGYIIFTFLVKAGRNNHLLKAVSVFSLILFFVSFGLDIVPFVQSPKLIFSPAMCSL